VGSSSFGTSSTAGASGSAGTSGFCVGATSGSVGSWGASGLAGTSGSGVGATSGSVGSLGASGSGVASAVAGVPPVATAVFASSNEALNGINCVSPTTSRISLIFGFACAIATFPPLSVIFPYQSVKYPIDLLFM